MTAQPHPRESKKRGNKKYDSCHLLNDALSVNPSPDLDDLSSHVRAPIVVSHTSCSRRGLLHLVSPGVFLVYFLRESPYIHLNLFVCLAHGGFRDSGSGLGAKNRGYGVTKQAKKSRIYTRACKQTDFDYSYIDAVTISNIRRSFFQVNHNREYSAKKKDRNLLHAAWIHGNRLVVAREPPRERGVSS